MGRVAGMAGQASGRDAVKGARGELRSALTEGAGDAEEVDVEAVVRQFARHLRLLSSLVSSQYVMGLKDK